MRTIDGRIAGSGLTLAFREDEEIWHDKKVRYVIFPKHDDIHSKDLWKGHINDLDHETKLRLGLM